MFNIQAVLYQILAAMTVAYGDDWSMVKNTAEEYFNDARVRLESLLSARVKGEVSTAFITARLKDEMRILESELLSFEVIAESVAQEAINAALETFQKLLDSIAPPKQTS